MLRHSTSFFFFFFNDTATTEIYTLSLHDALPISLSSRFCSRGASLSGDGAGFSGGYWPRGARAKPGRGKAFTHPSFRLRSEEHTSELQSRLHLVCRLLLEKKKEKNI